jgi:hypothetical protein
VEDKLSGRNRPQSARTMPNRSQQSTANSNNSETNNFSSPNSDHNEEKPFFQKY